MPLQMRKNFPKLGDVTVDARAKNEEDINNATTMTGKCKEI